MIPYSSPSITTVERSDFRVGWEGGSLSIIATSAQFRLGVDGAGSAARALGVERVIAKPFSREALLHAVRSVIGLPVVDTG